jgi:hypothetical protein
MKSFIYFIITCLSFIISCTHHKEHFYLTGRWDAIDSLGPNGNISIYFKKNQDKDSLSSNYILSYEVYTLHSICSDFDFNLAKFYYDTTKPIDKSLIIKVRDGECGHNDNGVPDSFSIKLDILASRKLIIWKILDSLQKDICCLPSRDSVKFIKF